jgi:hypothetical protein
MVKAEPPPLAIYRSISSYIPVYGDFVVWSGWFVTWNGVVSSYDDVKEQLEIVFSTLPFLLFTMEPKEQNKNKRTIDLDNIRNSSNGNFAVCQHDYAHNVTVWYI